MHASVQQLASGTPGGIRPEFLVAIFRNLVRDSSGDVVTLAILAAIHETDASADEIDAVRAAMRAEQEKSFWPKGFMPEM